MALTALVAETNQNEVACGNLLAQAASVLLPLGGTLIVVDAEMYTSVGNVDLLVAVDETVAGGTVVRRLDVWELKAPQVSAFRVETGGRASPTKELYSAENQLFHYHAQLAGSVEDRRKFGVLAESDVRLGGIIIGTQDSFVKHKPKVATDRGRRLAETARNIRDRLIYQKHAMRLLDWTTVLRWLDETSATHTTFAGASSVPVPLHTGPTVGSTGDLLPGVSLGATGCEPRRATTISLRSRPTLN